MIRKQIESNEEIKQNERNQKRENIVEDFDLGRFIELAASNEIYVNSSNLHEIKNENLQDYTSGFELNGLMIIVHVQHKTNIRFKNVDHFESYINAVDNDYDSEDFTFSGFVYKLSTPQFNAVKRSAYAKGTNYMREIVQFHGRDC